MARLSATLVDTSIVVDALRKQPAALRFLAALPAPPMCSEVSRTEILRGMRSPERTSTERFLQTLRWIPVDETVSRQAGELGRAHRRSHRGLGVADLLVAASAITTGAELATTNVRHFPMFPGLEAPYRS